MEYLKFGAIAATLSDHASVWMSGALQHTTEITVDQPDEASARMFARQMYTLLILGNRSRSALITMAWKRGEYCINGISRKRDQGFGTKEQFLQRMKDWESATAGV